MYNRAYIMNRFEWDPGKAAANLAKHGIDFTDATAVFFDEQALNLPDDYEPEERYLTVGVDALGRCLAVIYTWRGVNVRIISARRATRSEARYYSRGEQ